MSIWEELLKLNDWLAAKRQIKSEPIDLSKARLTKEIVLEKADEVAQKEGWSHLVPSEPVLWKDEKDNLIWGVTFLLKGRTTFYFGTRAGLSIDDETGKIIEKYIYPR
jgi:hypothetical protein